MAGWEKGVSGSTGKVGLFPIAYVGMLLLLLALLDWFVISFFPLTDHFSSRKNGCQKARSWWFGSPSSGDER